MSNKTECEILLDRIEKLPLVPRASALMRILRGIVKRSHAYESVYAHEVEEEIHRAVPIKELTEEDNE